jgi:hypothetical protein
VIHLAIAYDFDHNMWKNPPVVLHRRRLRYLTFCISSLSHTSIYPWTVLRNKAIKAQLAIWWYPPFIKKSERHISCQHSSPLPSPQLLCLSSSKRLEPARSNDGDDQSPSAQPLGGKGLVHRHLDTHSDPCGRWLAFWCARAREVWDTPALRLQPPNDLFRSYSLLWGFVI